MKMLQQDVNIQVFFFVVVVVLLQKALLFPLGARLRQVSRVVNKVPSSCRKGLQAEALTPGGLPAVQEVQKVGAALAEPWACRSMKAGFGCFSPSSMASTAPWVLPCSFWVRVKHEGGKTSNRLPYQLSDGGVSWPLKWNEGRDGSRDAGYRDRVQYLVFAPDTVFVSNS